MIRLKPRHINDVISMWAKVNCVKDINLNDLSNGMNFRHLMMCLNTVLYEERVSTIIPLPHPFGLNYRGDLLK